MDNSIIMQWLVETIKNDTWRNFDSLHIDDIDSKYESKKNWLNGGIECLYNANKIIHQLSFKDKKVFLLLSLEGNSEKQGINFNSSDELESQFDETPPSLYVYEDSWSNFIDTLQQGHLISKNILNIDGFDFYHIEYKEEGDLEYRRSIISVID